MTAKKELSRDRSQLPPCGFYAGDTNLRRYVGNDPTDQVDPAGTAPVRQETYPIQAQIRDQYAWLAANPFRKQGVKARLVDLPEPSNPLDNSCDTEWWQTRVSRAQERLEYIRQSLPRAKNEFASERNESRKKLWEYVVSDYENAMPLAEAQLKAAKANLDFTKQPEAYRKAHWDEYVLRCGKFIEACLGINHCLYDTTEQESRLLRTKE